jgi:hypothetical protein
MGLNRSSGTPTRGLRNICRRDNSVRVAVI